MILYVLGIVFICFLSFRHTIRGEVWSGLFWLLIFFAGINAASKTFFTENREKSIYNYSLYHPSEFIFSKLIYNLLLVWMVSISGVIAFSWMISFPVQDTMLFFITILLGGMALSGTLTLMGCIASKTGNSFTVMSLLSMPVCIPIMLICLRLTRYALDGLERSLSYNYLLALLLIDVIIVSLSFFLFRYLWRE